MGPLTAGAADAAVGELDTAVEGPGAVAVWLGARVECFEGRGVALSWAEVGVTTGGGGVVIAVAGLESDVLEGDRLCPAASL